MDPTDKDMYQELSGSPNADDDEVMHYNALAKDLEAELEAGSDLEDALGSDEEEPEEEDPQPDLMDSGGMHDGEADAIEKLRNSKEKPRLASSLTAAAKLRAAAIERAESPENSADEEGYDEDDEGEEDEDGNLLHYGHEEEVPEEQEGNDDFVVPEPVPKGVVLDDDDEEYVDPQERPALLRRRAGFLSAMNRLRELLPEDMIIPDGSTMTKEHKDLNVLFADERDYGDFCMVCTKRYHELLLGITSSTTRKTTAIDKEVQERYKRAEIRFETNMMLVGTNIMLRVSDRNFGKPAQVGNVKGLHPWYVTWARLRHAVDLRPSPEPVKIPADGYCCVTGHPLKKDQKAYLVGLVRKELNDRTSTELYPTYVYVSLYDGPAPECYLRFVQAAFTLWNYKVRIYDWMKEWKASNPLGSAQAETGPGNLAGSERGRTKLSLLYLEFKTHAAYVHMMLSKE